MADVVYIEGYRNRQMTLVANTSQASGDLDEGDYDVWCDVDCFIKVSDDGAAVTVTNGYKVFAGNVITVHVEETRQISVIAAAVGTFNYHRVG